MATLSEEISSPNLPRVLGPWQATSIVAGTIIGSGIFLVPQEMMRATGSSRLVYLAWIAAGLLSLAASLALVACGKEPAATEPVRAVRTLMAEETRLGMLVGVAVGFELARTLEGGPGPQHSDQ